MIRTRARAKVNLFLEVLRRRPDGYHDLATLFARVGAGDSLSIRKGAPGIALKVSGVEIGAARPEDNIVHKAASRFFSAFKIAPAVEIRLRKVLPVGAGLGGGSSDAAAALLGLARLHRLPRSAFPKLMRIAASAGSDVPFFMLDTAFAVGRGRGEKLRPLKAAGRLPYVVLVYPGVPVYTKEVYGRLKVAPPAEIKRRLKSFRALCAHVKNGGFVPGEAGGLFNRLEDPVLPRHRAVRLARRRLLELGAEAALMSGSGASVFGLCRGRARAAAVAAGMRCDKSYRVFLTRFC